MTDESVTDTRRATFPNFAQENTILICVMGVTFEIVASPGFHAALVSSSVDTFEELKSLRCGFNNLPCGPLGGGWCSCRSYTVGKATRHETIYAYTFVFRSFIYMYMHLV